MTSENVQIEQFENTVANTQLKQLSWQIDAGNPAESKGSYKAQSGAVLTLLSELKILELLASVETSIESVWVTEANGDKVLYSDGGVELERVRDDGTIAYDGATIPDGIDPSNWKNVFYKGGRCVITRKGTNGSLVYDCLNCYLHAGIWRAFETGHSFRTTTRTYLTVPFKSEEISVTSNVDPGNDGDEVDFYYPLQVQGRGIVIDTFSETPTTALPKTLYRNSEDNDHLYTREADGSSRKLGGFSETYAPTTTGTPTNCTVDSISDAIYTRVDDTITVDGVANVTPTTVGEFDFLLVPPVTPTGIVRGSATSINTTSIVKASGANINIDGYNFGGATQEISYHYSYEA